MASAVLSTQPDAARAVAAPQPVRRTMLDVMRLVAAYAIVWLHAPQTAQPWTAWGRFAVPFFTAAAVYLVWEGLQRKPGRPVIEYAQGRFWRIYVPFLAWSLIYLGFKGAKALLLPGQPNDFPGVEFLWLGSFFHLWFMPFILLTTLAVFCLAKPVVGHRYREELLLLGCVLAGWLIAWAPVDRNTADASFSLLALDALPAACWGLALAVAVGRGASWLNGRGVALAGLLAAVVLTAVVWQFGRNRLAENLAGCGCLLFAVAPWQAAGLARVARLGGLAYGIYLSHLLFIKTLQAVANRCHLADSLPLDSLVFAVAALGSTLLAWLLSRHRSTRWLVG